MISRVSTFKSLLDRFSNPYPEYRKPLNPGVVGNGIYEVFCTVPHSLIDTYIFDVKYLMCFQLGIANSRRSPLVKIMQ